MATKPVRLLRYTLSGVPVIASIPTAMPGNIPVTFA